MPSIIEQFREFQLQQCPEPISPEEMALLDAVLAAEDALWDILPPEHHQLLLAYSRAVNAYHAASESAAFRHGVQCAMQFLREALPPTV